MIIHFNHWRPTSDIFRNISLQAWIYFLIHSLPLTFSEHFLITFVNSFTTISQHFNEGALSFSICIFTMASKAISGVNRPDLKEKIWYVTCDFQQCGILTCVDSDEPVQPPFMLRNSKWCSVSRLTFIEYSSG